MGKWFAQAAEIDRLRRELDFMRRQRDDAERWGERQEALAALAQKALASERQKKDKILLRYADQVSRQQKLPEHFVKDIEPPVIAEEVLPVYEQERIEWAARQLRQADMDAGADAPELSVYIEKIKEDPTQVFL